MSRGWAASKAKAPTDYKVSSPSPLGWLATVRARVGPDWAAAWWLGSTLWLATRVALVLVTYFGMLLTSFTASSTPAALLAAWKQWDANWYVEIAQHGYNSPQTTAFFPLYPLMIRAVHVVAPGLSYFAGAVILSNVALLGALVLLIRLLTREFGSEIARVTAVLFLAYPAAFYLSTGYSESVFLLWVFGAFLALRSGNWLMAGVLAGLATLTRPTGGMLALAFGWEYLRQSPVSWATVRARGLSLRQWANDHHALGILFGRLCAVALMPLAVLLYAGYLWKRFGDPLLFKKVEGSYWNHHSALPTKGLYLGLVALFQQPFTTFVTARGLLDVVPIILFIVVSLLGITRLPLSFSLFGLAVVGLSLVAPIPGQWPLQSGIRYLLPVFPVFVVLALWSRRWPLLDAWLVSTWLMLQAVLIFLFLHGGWII